MEQLDTAPEPGLDFSSPIPRGFHLYVDNWRLLPLFLLMSLLGNIIVTLLSPGGTDPATMNDMRSLALLCLFPLVSLAVYFLLLLPATIGMTVVLGFRALGRPVTAGAALQHGFTRFLPYIGVLILQTLLTFVLVIPAVPVVILFALSMPMIVEGHSSSDVMIGAVGLALACGLGLLLLTVLLYVLARIYFAVVAVMLAGLGPLEALQHSWNLTEHKVLRVIGIMAVVAIPLFLLSMVPALVASWLPVGGLTLFVRLVFIVAATLYAPGALAVLIVLYYRLRAELEPDPAAFAGELP